MLELGTEAADFTLKDQHGQPVTLSAFRGVKNVLLVFFPLAFTGICQGELDRLRDHLPEFDTDVEANQGKWQFMVRQSGAGQRAGKSKSVEQAKGERYDPGMANGEAGFAAP